MIKIKENYNLNNTIDISKIKFNITINDLSQNPDFTIKNIISQVCNQWEGMTYNSHIGYVKILLLIPFVLIIDTLYMKFLYDIFDKKNHLFAYCIHKILITSSWGLLTLVIMLIFQATYIQLSVVENMSNIEIIKYIIWG